jgi:hypothetical protein
MKPTVQAPCNRYFGGVCYFDHCCTTSDFEVRNIQILPVEFDPYIIPQEEANKNNFQVLDTDNHIKYLFNWTEGSQRRENIEFPA